VIRFDLPLIFLVPYLFLLGAVIGSFLNVCIYRLPNSERLSEQIRGLWSPPSHCPRCGRRLLRRDNLPVLGWLLLRGRCRFCKTRISPRYPLIEAANGLLFIIMFFAEVPTGWNATLRDSCLFTPLGPQGDPASTLFSPIMVAFLRWAYHMVLVESLVVASFIDLDLRIIPDGATLPAMAAGVLGGLVFGCVYIVPVWYQDVGVLEEISSLLGGRFASLLSSKPVPGWITLHPHLHGLAVSVAGLVVGGGTVWMVRIIGEWVLKREAMGFGDVILMATGTEVGLCIEAYEKLTAEGVKARVVSMPSWEIFERQDTAYKQSVLPSSVTARVSVEMAATFGWERYVGLKGQKVGMHRFGASAPLKDLLKFFGFTVEAVVAAARKAITEK